MIGRGIQNRRAKKTVQAERGKMSALANEADQVTQKAASLRKSVQRGSLFNNLSNKIEAGKQGTIRNLIRAGGGKQALMAGVLGVARQAAQEKGKALNQAVATALPGLLQQELAAQTAAIKAKGDVQQDVLEEKKAFAAQVRGALSKEGAALKGGLATALGNMHQDMTNIDNVTSGGGKEVDSSNVGKGLTSMFKKQSETPAVGGGTEDVGDLPQNTGDGFGGGFA
jgi:hypothetical protein